MVHKMNRKNYKLKGCPRCGGDLLCDSAYGDFEEVCLQCGYRNYDNNQYNSGAQQTVELFDLPGEVVRVAETTRLTHEFELSRTFAGTENPHNYTSEAEILVDEQDRIEARDRVLREAEEIKNSIKAASQADSESYLKYFKSLLSLNVAREQSKNIKKHLEEIERIAYELKTLKIGTTEAIKRLRGISEEVSL